MKKCQTCIYFVCYKWQCNINNKEGCEEYESEASKLIKESATYDQKRIY